MQAVQSASNILSELVSSSYSAIAKESIQGGNKLETLLEDNATATVKFTSDTRLVLDNLGEQTLTFLSQKQDQGGLLQQDVATGDTPRKRQWPPLDEPTSRSTGEDALVQNVPVNRKISGAASSTRKSVHAHSVLKKSGSTAFKVLADKVNVLNAVAEAAVHERALKGT